MVFSYSYTSLLATRCASNEESCIESDVPIIFSVSLLKCPF